MNEERLRALAEAVLSEDWDPWDGTQGYEPTPEQKAYIEAASPEAVLNLLDWVSRLGYDLRLCEEGHFEGPEPVPEDVLAWWREKRYSVSDLQRAFAEGKAANDPTPHP